MIYQGKSYWGSWSRTDSPFRLFYENSTRKNPLVNIWDIFHLLKHQISNFVRELKDWKFSMYVSVRFFMCLFCRFSTLVHPVTTSSHISSACESTSYHHRARENRRRILFVFWRDFLHVYSSVYCSTHELILWISWWVCRTSCSSRRSTSTKWMRSEMRRTP